MKFPIKAVLVALVILPAMASAAKLNVVSTLPDFASIAREIGGEYVTATSIAKGTEDSHFIDARPSFIRLLNQADFLLEGGAELESGWLPPLLQNARNPKIQPGGPGLIVMAEGIELLDVPPGPIDRAQGDVHPAGNPHYWLDPKNGIIIGEHLARVFTKADPGHANIYAKNLERFTNTLVRKIEQWTKALTPLKGLKILTYHKTFDYFAARFGLAIVGQLEPRPGIEPSPSHLNALIPKAKEQAVKLILIEPFRPRKKAEYVAQAIKGKVLVLPEKTGGAPKVDDYISLFDYNVTQLLKATQNR